MRGRNITPCPAERTSIHLAVDNMEVKSCGERRERRRGEDAGFYTGMVPDGQTHTGVPYTCAVTTRAARHGVPVWRRIDGEHTQTVTSSGPPTPLHSQVFPAPYILLRKAVCGPLLHMAADPTENIPTL
ncbi:hypothetical protein Bbelb_030900 [Branchiostoma belcheri]|nr:hypothetical protein Bbelb_030900 [Branchiostoma belcheri]